MYGCTHKHTHTHRSMFSDITEIGKHAILKPQIMAKNTYKFGMVERLGVEGWLSAYSKKDS